MGASLGQNSICSAGSSLELLRCQLSVRSQSTTDSAVDWGNNNEKIIVSKKTSSLFI